MKKIFLAAAAVIAAVSFAACGGEKAEGTEEVATETIEVSEPVTPAEETTEPTDTPNVAAEGETAPAEAPAETPAN